jgi:hypothetical protein
VADAQTHGFRLERDVPASPEQVWAALVALLDRAGHEAGRPRPSEVGGETRFSLDEWALVEQTTVADAPSRRVYRIVDGAPVDSYEGVTEVHPDGAGCRLTWTVTAVPSAAAADFDAFMARAQVAVERGIEAVLAGLRESGAVEP